MAFVREQQAIAREERRVQREEAQHNREEAAQQREAEAAARVHELEVIRLRGEAPVNPDRNNSKAPKLPSFVEGKDQIDNFILYVSSGMLEPIFGEKSFSESPFDW